MNEYEIDKILVEYLNNPFSLHASSKRLGIHFRKVIKEYKDNKRFRRDVDSICKKHLSDLEKEIYEHYSR